MIQSESPLIPSSNLEERVLFIQNRRKGFSPNQVLREKIKYEQQNVISKAKLLMQTLIEKREESEDVLKNLIQEVEVINVAEPGEAQLQNIAQMIQQLKKIQDQLTKKKASDLENFLEIQKQQNDLECTLRHLLQAAHIKSSRLPLQTTFQVSERLCLHISNQPET